MTHFKAYSANPGGLSTKTPAVALGADERLGAIYVPAAALAKFESECDLALAQLVERHQAWATNEGKYAEIRAIVKQRGR